VCVCVYACVCVCVHARVQVRMQNISCTRITPKIILSSHAIKVKLVNEMNNRLRCMQNSTTVTSIACASGPDARGGAAYVLQVLHKVFCMMEMHKELLTGGRNQYIDVCVQQNDQEPLHRVHLHCSKHCPDTQ